MKKIISDLICIKCKKNKKLKLLKKILFCNSCKEAYPILNGIPVMLIKNNDVFNLKRALLPAKYRVEKYGD